MNSLLEAIAINNEGVRLLKAGNLSAGLDAFHRAALLMRDSAEDVAEWTRDLQPERPCNNNNHSNNSSNSVICFEQRPCQSTLAGLQSGHCYVYDRPLLLPTDLLTISSRDDADSIVLTSSASIIFNLALACHQHGKITGQEQPLTKACHLYGLVVKIIDGANDDDDKAAHHHGALHCLALNNLAQLHYEQCDYKKSATCMASMFDLLQFTDYLEAYLEETEADEIRLNLLHLQPPSVAHAA